MNFSELEQLMFSRGVTSLAEIARILHTTPQAVSNWKARNQVPHHIVATISKITPPAYGLQSSAQPTDVPFTMEEDTISLSDILLTIAQQLKVILMVPFITIFLTFTYIQFTFQPYYTSSAILLLPKKNQSTVEGLAGVAAQFGVNVNQGGGTDLSSPSLFPELVKSHTFAKRMFDEKFYVEKYQQELSLLSILTLTDEVEEQTVDREILVRSAMGTFHEMVEFESVGSLSFLRVKATEPLLARDINIKVLGELQKLNHYFKSQNVTEKIRFINNRIASVGDDLEISEQKLKKFREQNRQISSPALQLDQERLTRDVDIQKGIYLTLKQQLELANIQKIQSGNILQILDEPQVPLTGSRKNLIYKVLLAGILGVGFGIFLGFFRAYVNNSDINERRKLRRVRNFLKKKGIDFFLDHRVYGIISLFLLGGLPFFLNHKSINPVFFGMYSVAAIFMNTIYILILIISISLFIYIFRKK
ncbi:MAG: hypothetical protein HN982_02730 [Candidatus Marinimicrobia bacterium]|jgi:uncharacterized protein involved in exopolysaccharide biosynthesis|nr:hypothetical protein [Candidatus Neomarinimicrobiota bacterium]